ncbi:hypothetical protein PLAN_70523 [Planktothrix rubescens CCAP 1459/22]|uniref:Uncharacterized protein n=1 Tax=Planktothrix rubescens CCAP 1459/22 TaxID=329571 RepID=A0A6J7ZU71_PLARU|nr:hypothetical protein PLAN_70523 [Planktothrix rubescens NIVA-CYA 18]
MPNLIKDSTRIAAGYHRRATVNWCMLIFIKFCGLLRGHYGFADSSLD